ncbi:MAG: Aspartokinase [Candelina mexicana]|nr:MAG: Aspartokinase [Candelina mexicana]
MRKNISSRDWIVQKFGGTSVGKSALSIAEIVQSSLDDNRVAIVCSARSSQSKAQGTTNRLLRAAQVATQSDPRNFQAIVDAIQTDHEQAANDYIRSPTIHEELMLNISKEIQELSKDLGATPRRSDDTIVSKGEKLSAQFVTALLQDRGVDSIYVDLSDVINFEVSDGLSQSFYDRLARALAQNLVDCGDRVPVMTGYFGSVPGGLLNEIGRGYTDFCAALFAVGTKAKELQVWKEVDGIYTADPRKVPTARLLTSISPGEAAELTFYGSEVIHPFTMEQVIRAKIPIRIKNVLNPQAGGTVIIPDSQHVPSQITPGYSPKTFRTRSLSALTQQQQRPKRPTAVTVKHNIIVINVHSNKRSLAHGFFKNIFSILDDWRLTIDLISTSEVHVSMALHSESALLTGGAEDEVKILDRALDGAIKDLHVYGDVDIIPNMAILSLVGKQMRNMMGIAGKMFYILGENNVNIEMISQGASEINISCVIEERDADRALNILHTNLFTFLE